MRSSSSLFALSAIAILSTALLCGLSSTAVSQTATGSATPLPSITVEAPKQTARPPLREERAAVAPTNAQVTQKIQKPQTAPVWNPGEPWPPRWANFEACAAAGKKWAWDQNSTSLWCGGQPYGAAGDNRLSRNLR